MTALVNHTERSMRDQIKLVHLGSHVVYNIDKGFCMGAFSGVQKVMCVYRVYVFDDKAYTKRVERVKSVFGANAELVYVYS